MSPLVDVCNRLMRFDISLIPDDTRPYFRDVYDHVVRINEMIDNLRELLTTALEANLSLISVSQNEDTKRLAAWAAIIAVPTMIAGVYGMNFDNMPELHWQFGYPLIMRSWWAPARRCSSDSDARGGSDRRALKVSGSAGRLDLAVSRRARRGPGIPASARHRIAGVVPRQPAIRLARIHRCERRHK